MATAPAGAANQQLAIQIAHDHILATKGWAQKDYHLEILREEGSPDSPLVVLDAVHQEDLRLQGRGSSLSVQLHIDLNQRKVVKELAYQ